MIEYRVVPDFPDYKAGDDGNIWSYKHKKPKKLSLDINNDGGVRVLLYKNNVGRHYLVSKLILQTFIGPLPKNCTIVRLNCDLTNNSLENLRYSNSPDIENESYKAIPGFNNHWIDIDGEV